MLTGTVSHFNSDKGFGFIELDGNKANPIFVYRSAIMTATRTLAEGQKVSFQVVRGLKNVQAVMVKPLED
ncbi:cold shock domain-containing protein [Ligilactobacillus equi]|uniref:cold-shock protein n=1 Tax=Ligilactobacillus equi TaxID=137357 RepID=UPI002ED66B2A